MARGDGDGLAVTVAGENVGVAESGSGRGRTMTSCGNFPHNQVRKKKIEKKRNINEGRAVLTAATHASYSDHWCLARFYADQFVAMASGVGGQRMSRCTLFYADQSETEKVCG